MHFALSAGFGYFNRHFGTRMEKGRKEIRAVLQPLLLRPVSLEITNSAFPPSSFKPFITFTELRWVQQRFSELRTFQGCAAMPGRRKAEHGSNFP